MIKEGILAAYLLWMAAVDAKTKTVPVWPGIAGILLFSVMGVVKGQGIPSLLGGIVIGVFCFTVSVLSRQAVGAGDGIVLGVTGAALKSKIPAIPGQTGTVFVFASTAAIHKR